MSWLPQICARQKPGVLGLETEQWQLLSTLGPFPSSQYIQGPWVASVHVTRLLLVTFLCVWHKIAAFGHESERGEKK